MIQTFITSKGADLIAKAVAQGFPISFVSAEIGTGQIGDSENPEEYTGLKAKYADALLSGTTYEGNATCRFAAQYTASNLQTAVLISEVGIYATDPDDGKILFAYTNFGEDVDRLFPSEQASFYKFYDVVVSFTTSSGVNVTINPASLVPATEVVSEAQANKILKLNDAGKLPTSITGDAGSVGGKAVEDLALKNHAHDAATQSKAGFLSAQDKADLDTLKNRVNQGLKNTDSPTFANLTVNGVINGATFN